MRYSLADAYVINILIRALIPGVNEVPDELSGWNLKRELAFACKHVLRENLHSQYIFASLIFFYKNTWNLWSRADLWSCLEYFRANEINRPCRELIYGSRQFRLGNFSESCVYIYICMHTYAHCVALRALKPSLSFLRYILETWPIE